MINLIKINIFLCFILIGSINANAKSNNVHGCFGLNLVEQINAYQTPDLVKTPTQTFTSLTALQNQINAKTDHNGAVYALASNIYYGSLKIKDKKNLCVYTNPNNPATINASGENFGINAYNSTKGVDSNIEILNFRITGSKFHGIYIGSDNDPPYAPRGVWVAGNEVFNAAQNVGGGIVVRNAFEGADIKIESNEVYNISPNKLDGSGEGIYIGEGNDPEDYSSNIHIIGNNLHDLTGEAIDIKRKSANILIEYNKINKIKVHSQGAIVLGLDPLKNNDSYNGKYIVRRNSISNVTTRKSDGNFIVVGNASTLIEENVMWNAVKHGIDVYNDCDGPNKNVKIQNNIIWGYEGQPIRSNVGNGNKGPVNNCTVTRTTNIVQSNRVGSECRENVSVFAGPLTTLAGFAPVNSNNDNPNPTVKNSISWNPQPSTINAGTNQIPVKYTINQNGLVVVQLFNSSWKNIGEKAVQVSTGENQQISVPVSTNASPTETSYVQALLVGSNWEKIHEENPLQVKVTFEGNSNPEEPESISNSIDWNTVPASVTSGTNDIKVKYNIDQNGIVVVQLFNSNWNQIGQQYLAVSSGANQTATLSLKPSQTPAATNYLQAKLLSPSWGDIGVAHKQVEVTYNLNGKLKNEELNNLSILPNPFNHQTLINYVVEKSGAVSISIHSADGKEVKELVNNKYYEAGNHQFSIDGSQLSSGIYLIHFNAAGKKIIEKLYKY